MTRSDHYYVCKHVIEPSTTKQALVEIPGGEDWGGVTDRYVGCAVLSHAR
jgi:hypothetical protein